MASCGEEKKETKATETAATEEKVEAKTPEVAKVETPTIVGVAVGLSLIHISEPTRPY